MFDSSFGDSIDLHLSCDPDRCFRLGLSGQVECCGNLCQGLEGLEGLAGTPQTWHQVTKPPLRWRFEITSFLSLSGGGGLVGKIVDFGDFLQMLLREYALLWWLKHYHCYSSVWCIASNDIHYLKWSRKVQLFNWFPSKGNLDNVFQFETTWGLEIWWAATNVGWEFCLSWIIGDLSGSVQKKCSIYQMLTIQTIDHCWHKRFALHDSQDILALISGQNRGA